jgi:hypothetical protein
LKQDGKNVLHGTHSLNRLSCFAWETDLIRRKITD